ncbi:membrane hypothetical protein [Gammaproteobacteria bacterium]
MGNRMQFFPVGHAPVTEATEAGGVDIDGVFFGIAAAGGFAGTAVGRAIGPAIGGGIAVIPGIAPLLVTEAAIAGFHFPDQAGDVIPHARVGIGTGGGRGGVAVGIQSGEIKARLPAASFGELTGLGLGIAAIAAILTGIGRVVARIGFGAKDQVGAVKTGVLTGVIQPCGAGVQTGEKGADQNGQEQDQAVHVFSLRITNDEIETKHEGQY